MRAVLRRLLPLLAVTRIAAAQPPADAVQVLANELAAYAAAPRAEHLLAIAATLEGLGRPADAANTYQRYLAAPDADPARTAEIQSQLRRLDAYLAVLTVRAAAAATAVSLDAGPFVALDGALVVRVRPGFHLLRVRREREPAVEIAIHAVAREPAELLAGGTAATSSTARTYGWLLTGDYVSDGTGNVRAVLDRATGAPVVAAVPAPPPARTPPPVAHAPAPAIIPGLVGLVRIDAEGRGFAGGLGIAVSRGRLDAELLVLRSNDTGGYLGLRYRVRGGVVRPYAAAGIPGFVFDNRITGMSAGETETETRLAIGARVAAGVELFLNAHLRLHGEIGFEHFWGLDDTRFVADVWAPSLGVIGRL